MLDVIEYLLLYAYQNRIVGHVMIYLNISLGMIVFFYELWEYRRVKEYAWSWLKMAYALVGIGWAIAYIMIAILPPYYEQLFGAVVIRPGITITLCIIAAGAYSRRRKTRRH